MCRSLVEQSTNESTEAVVLISRTVVKLVDTEEHIVEFSGVNAIERIKKRCMCADELSSPWIVEKLSDNGFLGVLTSGSQA